MATMLLVTLVTLGLAALADDLRRRRTHPVPAPVRPDARPVRLVLAAWQGELRPGERRLPER